MSHRPGLQFVEHGGDLGRVPGKSPLVFRHVRLLAALLPQLDLHAQQVGEYGLAVRRFHFVQVMFQPGPLAGPPSGFESLTQGIEFQQPLDLLRLRRVHVTGLGFQLRLPDFPHAI